MSMPSSLEIIRAADRTWRILANAYERNHPDLYRVADRDGWRWNLEHHVKLAAHALAQRDFLRDRGMDLADPKSGSHLKSGEHGEYIHFTETEFEEMQEAARSAQALKAAREKRKAA